jgi:hypothetical protein
MGNGITILPRCDWTPMRNLSFVILSNNPITHVSADAFFALEKTDAGMLVLYFDRLRAILLGLS